MIDLSYNLIENKDFNEFIASLCKNCKELLSLDINKNNITEKGFRVLMSKIQEFTNLKFLNLSIDLIVVT